MKRRVSLFAVAAGMVVVLAAPSMAAAHNRALSWLPNGDCVQPPKALGSFAAELLRPDERPP